MDIPDFLYPFAIDEHLGYFCILAIMNSTTMNIELLISLWDPDFNSFDKYQEIDLLEHTAVLFLIFWGTYILFSTEAAPFCILK